MKNHGHNDVTGAHRKAHYQSADTNGRLIINLRDLSHTMRFLYEGKGSQNRVLIVLQETGAITQRALTEQLGIQPGSASEVFAKLENAGLILRTQSDSDRRTSVITLTEKGAELAAQAAEQRSRRHEEMFSCLSAEEKSQLLSLLEKVNSDWESRYRNSENTSTRPGHHHGRGGNHGKHGARNGAD